MSKAELVALLQQKKDEKIALVSSEMDALISAAESLEMNEGGNEELLAQISQLQSDLQAKQVELDDAKAKLSAVDALAKQIDSSIPDA